MAITRLEYLYERCINNTATAEERNELVCLLQEPGNESAARQFLHKAYRTPKVTVDISKDTAASILQAILQADDTGNKRSHIHNRPGTAPIHSMPKNAPPSSFLRRSIRWTAAAVLIVVLSGTYFLSGRYALQQTAPTTIAVPPQNRVLPGGNKAILTLSNGSKITLDSAANGHLAQQGNADVVKLANGQLAYTVSGAVGNQTLYNTMCTPRGGQYQLILPDGTKVWLNAASSIKYPTAFSGKERRLEISGEAYFEVAKNPNMPFKLTMNGVEIEVLGTHFNVMTYPEEHMVQTTLLEGSVKIKKDGSENLLLPGEQGSVMDDNDHTATFRKSRLQAIDIEEAVAWKNGMFQFNEAGIETIMKQVARWYDVDIIYKGSFPYVFVATISRNEELSKLLMLLELTNKVRFKVDNRKIIVMPK
jgi:ferric-dicitrate binding protein FerR (iron transport regulator)